MDVAETLDAVFENLQNRIRNASSSDDRAAVLESLKSTVMNIVLIGLDQNARELSESRSIKASWMQDLEHAFEL